MADHFLGKAQEYIKEHKDKPFFLYYALQQPHVPRTPHPRFEGKSGMGPRGDVIVEADWCVGEFYKTLEAEGILDNTLIIFSSDNGPVLNDGYYDDAVEKLGDHTPSGGLRGGKYSLFEAGAKVPFIRPSELAQDNATSDQAILHAEKVISRSGYSTIMDLYFLDCDSELHATNGQREQEYLLHLHASK